MSSKEFVVSRFPGSLSLCKWSLHLVELALVSRDCWFAHFSFVFPGNFPLANGTAKVRQSFCSQTGFSDVASLSNVQTSVDATAATNVKGDAAKASGYPSGEADDDETG